MRPSTAGTVASRNALKPKTTAYRLGLTRFPPFLQTPAANLHRHSTSLSRATSANLNTTETTMANVQVRQQSQVQPHQYEQYQYEQRQAAMSALQAPLPRHTSHFSALRQPIPNSYWATPFLLACEYPWAPSTPRPKLDALLAAGVRTFIDLTESGELLGYSQLLPLRAHSCGLPSSECSTIEYFRFPIPDRSLPSSPAFLGRIMDVLARCETQKRIAAVHCRGGIGRTGTVVGCWLVQSGRCRDGAEALDFIAKQWATVEKHKRFPCSPETGAQANFVRNFKRLPVPDVLSSSTSASSISSTGSSTSTISTTSASSRSTSTSVPTAVSGDTATVAATATILEGKDKVA